MGKSSRRLPPVHPGEILKEDLMSPRRPRPATSSGPAGAVQGTLHDVTEAAATVNRIPATRTGLVWQVAGG